VEPSYSLPDDANKVNDMEIMKQVYMFDKVPGFWWIVGGGRSKGNMVYGIGV